MNLKTVNLTPTRPPRLPWAKAAGQVLGRKYELDLIFANPAFMNGINRRYRRKNKSANVLAFALAPGAGEIVLEPALARREARRGGEDFKKYLWRLFIHALLHLKGFRHGRKMEELAQNFDC